LLARILEDKRRRWPNATFEVSVEPGLPPVTSDEASIDLIVRNIISNALKYGSPEGTVRITAERSGDMVAITVEDEGPGLSVERAERLFDLFYRADDARLRAQGAGIGLFVVRALTEASGGRVEAANRPEGGARFTVRLPIYVDLDDADD
ncbi:MAG: sensor histidine kinase, partial [Candidatus Limnocylindrales bacterium]